MSVIDFGIDFFKITFLLQDGDFIDKRLGMERK